jgi:type II restriction enzyme
VGALVNLVNYEAEAREAIKAFWGNREAARQKQIEAGKRDQGERAAVTAGKSMDGFVALVKKVVEGNGLQGATYTSPAPKGESAATLPGYFRATKNWDLVVIYRGTLVAALEMKSHVGPSFGNNMNNRVEEALGNAVDLWSGFRGGAFGDHASEPFLGYLLILEDTDRTRSPIKATAPHFPVMSEFNAASYARRYELFCQKLVQERHYSAAALLLSPRSGRETGEYRDANPSVGLLNFVARLAGHVGTAAAKSW